MPKKCPDCSSNLVEQTIGDVDMRCPNSRSCPAQLRERIYYIGSRAALDIDILGYEAANALLDAKIITDESDLFNLTKEKLIIANSGEPPTIPVDQIFERFKKGESPDAVGLGLAIVRRIIEHSQASVKYDYTGGLHTFSIRFRQVA